MDEREEVEGREVSQRKKSDETTTSTFAVGVNPSL